jgi:polyphosphate kinase 2 (PPK2 family)
VEGLIPERGWRRAYLDIVNFERTLADEGYLIIKFFLHISREEQKKRFDKLISDPLTAWQVLPEDWEHHKNYDEWRLAYEETFERTETESGPWTIVEATNRRYTSVKIFETIINSLETQLVGMNAMPDSAYWEQAEKDNLNDTQDTSEELEPEDTLDDNDDSL